MKKVKKSKGLSLPSNIVLGPNKAPTVEAEAEGRAPQDLVGIVPSDAGEVLEVGERELMTMVEA